ncbi:MAG: phycobiliprotein lyase [Cyanobacteria bacterium P01_D01_bin.73]
MDLNEFLDTFTGKWFSQRTTHDLQQKTSFLAKSDLWVDAVPSDDPAIKSLCDRYGVAADQVAIALKLRWEAIIAASPKKELGTGAIALLKGDAPNQGQVLSDTTSSGIAQPLPGTYTLGEDEALTFVLPMPNGDITERMWFASPNLRMRTSTVTEKGEPTLASFCSEIRMGGGPKKAE